MNRQRTLSTPFIKIRILCALMLMGSVTSVYGSDGTTLSDSISARGNPLTPANDPLPLKYYDDFSTSAGYLVYQPGKEGVSLVNMEDGPLTITTASDDDKDDKASSELRVWGKSDVLSVGVSLSSETSIPVSAGGDARAEIQIWGRFYNDLADGGVDGESDTLGDVMVSASIQIREDGGRRIQFCLGRDNGEDSGDNENMNLFNNGTDNCTRFNNFVPILDTVYQLSITLDREAKTLTLGLDDLIEVVNIETPVFIAGRDEKQIQVRNRGDAGFTVGTIHNVSNSLFSLDFEEQKVAIAPYRNYWDTQRIGNEIYFANGKANLRVTSTDEDNESVKIQTEGAHDYIEAIVNVSSDSFISEDGRVSGRVAGAFYNDSKDGGTGNVGEYDNNDATGDVFASLSLDYYKDGSGAYVCAWRSNDLSFDDATSLILRDDGSDCEQLSIVPQFDTDYKLSIEVDRENGELIYTVDEQSFKYVPTTSVFEPANHWKRAELRANHGSTTIGTIDDLRTSTTAVSLLESGNAIGRDAPEDPDTDTQDSGGSENGSGGGCSMVKGSNDSMMLILLLLATFGILVRRKMR